MQKLETYLNFKFSLQDLLMYRILVIKEDDHTLTIASDNPLSLEAKSLIYQLYPSKSILPIEISSSKLNALFLVLKRQQNIQKILQNISHDLKNIKQEVTIESSSILELIDILLSEAISHRASDLHIEATLHHCTVRERIDGMLQENFRFEKNIFYPLASRIKLLSSLDIAQSRMPQDGRFSRTIQDKIFDFRVSTLPTIHGESIVIRILESQPTGISLTQIGMNQNTLKYFQKSIQTPYGMVLVTGPTGAGKTTTLYATLHALKDKQRKIITVEDPVEYQIEGLQQVQIDEKVGIIFQTILKSILRQDPDTIMIGEIRDSDTLRIAIQSALTGHKVLSTLHTNSAILAIQRMKDMGIEPYLLSSAIISIIAQRLLRSLCQICKKKKIYTDVELTTLLGYCPLQKEFYSSVGCNTCQHTGYNGREMISEVLYLTPTIQTLILTNTPQELLIKQAKKEGYQPMIEDGFNKVLLGNTSLEELQRVIQT